MHTLPINKLLFWMTLSLAIHGAILVSFRHLVGDTADIRPDRGILELTLSNNTMLGKPISHPASPLTPEKSLIKSVPVEVSTHESTNEIIAVDFTRPEIAQGMGDEINWHPPHFSETETETVSGNVASSSVPAVADDRTPPAEVPAGLHELLHAAIDRAKHYPLLARRLGHQGITTLDFRLLPDGSVNALQIRRSSGLLDLDQAALDAVRSIIPFTPAQTYLSFAQSFQLDVVFRLH